MNFYTPCFIYHLQKELMKEIDDYLKLGELILIFRCYEIIDHDITLSGTMYVVHCMCTQLKI